MTVLGDLPRPPPVSEGVGTHSQKLSSFCNLQVIIKFRHLTAPETKVIVIAKGYQTEAVRDTQQEPYSPPLAQTQACVCEAPVLPQGVRELSVLLLQISVDYALRGEHASAP